MYPSNIKKTFFILTFCFLYPYYSSASDCVAVPTEDSENVVITELSRALTIVPTTNGFGRSCDGFRALKSEIDTRLSLFPPEQPLAVYEMGPGAGFILDYLLSQQRAGHYGARGIAYTYSDLSEENRESVEAVFTRSSSHTSNSCIPTIEHDTLVALKDSAFSDSFNLFIAVNTYHFLPPSQFLDCLRIANGVLKKGGIFALTLNYASNIKDPEFQSAFKQKSRSGNFWPGYGTTERETLRHLRTARFFQGNWELAVRASETFQVLGLLPLGESIQTDVLALMKNHAQQLQKGEVILNIHNQNSIRRLLEFCGFEVQSCNIYNEIYNGKFENSYMGIIASKQCSPNYVYLRPKTEGEDKEAKVEILLKKEGETPDDPIEIIHLEIQNALQLILRHPTKGIYTHSEIDAMLQRGITALRTAALKK